MNEQYLFYACILGAVGMVGYFVSRLFISPDGAKLRQRLNENGGGTGDANSSIDVERNKQKGGVVKTLKKIGESAAEPFMPSSREKQSTLRKELGRAGIYVPSAVRVVTGAKVILMAGGVGIGYGFGLWANQIMLGISLGGLVGYFAPRMWLKHRIKSNQMALQLALPDALDLMVVCVEAGLTVDAAMQRVGMELGIAHPALSRELGIAHMETRVGLSRSEALKNLGTRTGSPSLVSLASMLVQAERFGTSIAGALRIQADALRTKRQHAAEEMAAKASVKMSFPLVLFIFPATFIVLAGPTVIGLMHSALMTE